VGDDAAPAFVDADADLFQAKTRLITRKKGEWFAPSLLYE
jgi:4-diphosphocytidyl-2-C-methyl-D-erythritol kinase